MHAQERSHREKHPESLRVPLARAFERIQVLRTPMNVATCEPPHRPVMEPAEEIGRLEGPPGDLVYERPVRPFPVVKDARAVMIHEEEWDDAVAVVNLFDSVGSPELEDVRQDRDFFRVGHFERRVVEKALYHSDLVVEVGLEEFEE